VTGAFRHRHLISIEDLDPSDVMQILDAADAFFAVNVRPVRKVPTLRGKTIINLFYEASTRTRTSFELAGKRLSADVVNVAAQSSSVSKGETLLDTCKTLQAMHPDVLVMRHSASGAAHYVASRVDCSVVNAGDGAHEHPTQALLDAFTIRRARGRLEGLKIAICGDITHSRVARSDALLFNMFGAEVRFCAPRTLMPRDAGSLGVKVFDRLEPALEGADVIYLLRIQLERLAGAAIPTLREYARTFGVSERHLALAAEKAIVMHPGPMNRGVEINPALADSSRSSVLDQVEAGVAVRMAVLYLMVSGQGAESVREAAREA